MSTRPLPRTMTTSMPISKIAIVGAGTMGANIALNFATHGREVRLNDSDPAQLERALGIVRTNADLLRQHGLVIESVDQLIERIVSESRLEQAVQGVDLVIEAVPEKLQLKRHIFSQLDRLCPPETIFASNSSTFVPSAMALSLLHDTRKMQFLVMHYWNPAHLMPLVEIVPHPRTRPSVVDAVKALLTGCGKVPVVVRKEIAGFIGNRLAFALQREAMDLVSQGVASPEDIDLVARTSFGRRLPVTGIFGTADLGGLDVYLAICRTLFPELCSGTAPPPLLGRMVEQGNLGVKSGAGWSQYTSEQIDALREALTAELVHQLQCDRKLMSAAGGAGPA